MSPFDKLSASMSPFAQRPQGIQPIGGAGQTQPFSVPSNLTLTSLMSLLADPKLTEEQRKQLTDGYSQQQQQQADMMRINQESLSGDGGVGGGPGSI